MNYTTTNIPTFVTAPAVMSANGTIPLGVTETGTFAWDPESEPHVSSLAALVVARPLSFGPS